MLFKIVMLATCYIYLNMGHSLPQSHTANVEGRLRTHNSLPDKMQILQMCLYMTFQSHLLAKKFVITQMESNYTKCRKLLD